MTIPDKLCPMCFGNSLFSRLECPCLGGVCMWFNEETGKCVLAPIKAEAAAKAKPKAKKSAEE